MTHQEIKALAGHRAVPPWIMKLVSDAIAIEVQREREACAKLCDEQAKKWEESAEFESIAGSVTDMARAGTAASIADTIRARGEPTSRGEA